MILNRNTHSETSSQHGLFGRVSFERFLKDNSAVTVIEFAIIGPLLVVLYLASVEGFLLIRAKQEVSNASSTLAFAIARLPSANTDGLNSSFAASRLRFIQNDPDEAVFTVTFLEQVDNDTGRGIWRLSSDVASWDGGDGYRFDNSSPSDERDYYNSRVEYEVPAGLFDANGLIPGSSTIVKAEVNFTFENPIGFVFGPAFEFNIEQYHKPRSNRTGEDSNGNIIEIGIPRKYADCAQISRLGITYSIYSPTGQRQQQNDFTNANHSC